MNFLIAFIPVFALLVHCVSCAFEVTCTISTKALESGNDAVVTEFLNTTMKLWECGKNFDTNSYEKCIFYYEFPGDFQKYVYFLNEDDFKSESGFRFGVQKLVNMYCGSYSDSYSNTTLTIQGGEYIDFGDKSQDYPAMPEPGIPSYIDNAPPDMSVPSYDPKTDMPVQSNGPKIDVPAQNDGPIPAIEPDFQKRNVPEKFDHDNIDIKSKDIAPRPECAREELDIPAATESSNNSTHLYVILGFGCSLAIISLVVAVIFYYKRKNDSVSDVQFPQAGQNQQYPMYPNLPEQLKYPPPQSSQYYPPQYPQQAQYPQYQQPIHQFPQYQQQQQYQNPMMPMNPNYAASIPPFYGQHGKNDYTKAQEKKA